MLITYCSNDTSANYGPNVFAVEAGLLPYEDLSSVKYTHMVALEVEPDNIWGCPSALVIEVNGALSTVRPKSAAELLADMKPGKLQSIQAEKNRVRDSGFDVDNVHFDSDASARVAYLELAMRVQLDPKFSTPWKASDGTWVTMDATMFNAMYAAGSAHIASCFAWQDAKEVAVITATTPAELEAIGLVYGQ